MQRVNSAGVSRHRPGRRGGRLPRCGRATSPVAMNAGSPTSMSDGTGPSRSAAATASAIVTARRRAPLRTASSSSHRPVRLRWNRTRPADAELVGEARLASPPGRAPARRARRPPATTCRTRRRRRAPRPAPPPPPPRCRGRPRAGPARRRPTPRRVASSGRSVPARCPGSTTAGSTRGSIPARSSSPSSQSPVRASSIAGRPGDRALRAALARTAGRSTGRASAARSCPRGRRSRRETLAEPEHGVDRLRQHAGAREQLLGRHGAQHRSRAARSAER